MRQTLGILALCGGLLRADSSIELQRRAIEKQREAIRQRTPVAGFFVTPWLTPPPTPAVQANCDALPESQLSALVLGAAQKEAVNPALLRAMIRRESAGRPCAVSNKGAQGIMQLMPATQETLGVTDPFDPAENVNAGARYIREMLARYKGDLKLALAAYNAGPQKVEPGGTVPDFAETKAYVEAVMADVAKSNGPE